MDSSDVLSELRAIFNGLIGGGRYGMKIRLPHAAVMTLLFRKKTSFEDKIKIVLKSTYEHSRNLASFAVIYKVRKYFHLISLLFCHLISFDSLQICCVHKHS